LEEAALLAIVIKTALLISIIALAGAPRALTRANWNTSGDLPAVATPSAVAG
jgi:hypothetical protein